MNPRPAGMSDEEDISDSEIYFSAKHAKVVDVDWRNEYVVNYNYLQDHDEIKIFETRAIKACINGDLDVIQEYLEKYSINKFMHTGWTLLLYAALSVQLEIIEYLLKHDADPNTHKNGFTPLMALCSAKKELSKISLKCLVLLIEAKADVNATSRQRETALMYACKSQSEDFIIELLKHVKNINACDSDGKTALSYAVTYNKVNIVKILLEHGVDVTLRDRYNLTPKDIADAKDFTEISTMLTDENEEKIPYCEISQITSWQDLLPELYPRNKELLVYDISQILYGMGLERYNILFRGIDLKTFLQLTGDDLSCLGIDLTVHREQFLENLHKFHCKTWKVDSIGIIKKSVPYTIFDGVISLSNIKYQVGVIASSFQYIKNNLMQCAKENINFGPTEKIKYEEELTKTQNILKVLKNEAIHHKKLAQEINKKNGMGVPADFVTSPKKHRNKIYWIIPLSVSLIIGLYVYKTT